MSNQKFGSPIKQFSLTIPKNYNHDTQIDIFTKKTKNLKTTYRYDDVFTSENFINASNRLIPGLTYGVKIFPILPTATTVTTQDCAIFLQEQDVILVGAHGLTLAEELKPREFPRTRWIVSFDRREVLCPLADGKFGVPVVHHKLGGDRGFGVVDFDSEWFHAKQPAALCLLCFYNKSRKARNWRHV